jgi:Rrf2 family transcriptional regulator, iron-sulfur cluster assembly transcription factor
MLGIAAVVDIAVHGRAGPVAAKLLAARHNLPPRHLETLLQALVRSGILKGVRGPRGGYELAKERRKVTAGDVVRAAMTAQTDEDIDQPEPESRLVDEVVSPAVKVAGASFLQSLDAYSVEDLCRQAEEHGVFGGAGAPPADFTI